MNLLLKLSISFVFVACVWINFAVDADIPCAARECPGQSVVCVCNETYNDEIVREPVPLGQFVSYTSSKCGLRFYKATGVFRQTSQCACVGVELTLFPEEVFQQIEGFGGSVTDAAGINWLSLPVKLRHCMIDSYFGPKGIEYNMIRVPIGGSDFSTHPYTLNDLPDCDITLSNFSLTAEDYLLKLPMLKLARDASASKAQVLATTWSPPVWMKTNNNITGRNGYLKEEYYQCYADYHSKFIDSYTAEGIPIWGVTTTNEPMNAVKEQVPFNTLGWLPQQMGKWIAKNLGPTIRKRHSDVKIICADDQLYNLPIYVTMLGLECPEAMQYIDGVGVHWYGNYMTAPSLYRYISKCNPDKFIIATEACSGYKTNDVILGSWDRAMDYISDIIMDLSYNLVGWIDWNLCLNEQGGPNWVGNFVDSPIIVLNNKKEFVKQPMFYAMGHFSKWIPKGSYRINIKVKQTPGLEQIAFRTPEENIVVVLHNKNSAAITVTVVWESCKLLRL
ncbi:lysosomal acid glucosylceramidase-like isoform X2 [Choristoneura fumiferana]|uniref:lysosomal acid glucosylceramidase-like isoform X2 n=1 Tax=Choristoneura fumiferana TaxID=7141 RepID=UPI003D15D1F0